jgi:hypothetical protein
MRRAVLDAHAGVPGRHARAAHHARRAGPALAAPLDEPHDRAAEGDKSDAREDDAGEGCGREAMLPAARGRVGGGGRLGGGEGDILVGV